MVRIASSRPIYPYRDRRGAVLVEFALALPLLTLLIFGIIGYGQYFLLAHEVQQAANDAARAAIAGLNAGERAMLARESVAASSAAGAMGPDHVETMVEEAGALLIVHVQTDAREMLLLGRGFVPLPDGGIQRRAVVRLPGEM